MRVSKLLFTFLSSLIFISMFVGCNGKKGDDLTVHWDRDMCARCDMVISDRHNTVQVINPQTNKKYVFDDIGCMAVWFSKNKPVWQKSAKIWTTDAKTGEWIKAREAFYDNGNVTPMGYGYSSFKSRDEIPKGKKIFSYDEVIQNIM